VTNEAHRTALVPRIKELTEWLREDLPKAATALRQLIPELRKGLVRRYPNRKFFPVWPMDDPNAPPI
jgi:hypothetical protein